jgi:hypothetical protein
MKHISYPVFSLLLITNVMYLLSSDAKTIEEAVVRETVAKNPYKYFRDADKEKVIAFEVAYRLGDLQTVETMLTNKTIRIEDAALVFADNHTNPKILPACIAAIVQKDRYAVWKALVKFRAEGKETCLDHPHAPNRRYSGPTIQCIQTYLNHGLIIPEKRAAVDIDISMFKCQYLPILHYLVSPNGEDMHNRELDTLFEQLLQDGANPNYEADCILLIDVKEEKKFMIDVFTLIEKKASVERKAPLLALCTKYARTPVDTENQFYPDSLFYQNKTNNE